MRELRLIHPASAALRLALPVRRLMAMARAGEVPAVEMPGGEIRFDPSALAEWIDGLSSTAPEDPAITANTSGHGGPMR